MGGGGFGERRELVSKRRAAVMLGSCAGAENSPNYAPEIAEILLSMGFEKFGSGYSRAGPGRALGCREVLPLEVVLTIRPATLSELHSTARPDPRRTGVRHDVAASRPACRLGRYKGLFPQVFRCVRGEMWL